MEINHYICPRKQTAVEESAALLDNLSNNTTTKKNMKSIIDLSLSVAMKAHGGKKDIDGEAYILHPLAVGLMGSTDEERSTGFLHDVIENTNFIIEDLEAAGIPYGIVNAVKLLTHNPDTPYLDYIQNIIDSHDPVALKVRYNDLIYHLNKDKAHPEKLEIHTKALEMVKEALKDMKF